MMKMSGNMIDIAWNMTVLDINKTLRNSLDKVLKDKAVSKKERKLRAQGLLKLGNIFLLHGNKNNEGLAELKQQVSGQFTQ